MKNIYFADLTYNDSVLACDVMPIGIGYVMAYAKVNFGSLCETKLFKYADDFFNAVDKNPPDIYAGSCFVWNKNLTLLASKYVLEKNPNAMVVVGGIAFPLDKKRQKLFLQENAQIDFLIPYDGEIGFSNLLEAYFKANEDKEKIKELPVAGVLYLDKNGDLVSGEKTKRPKNLDIFPSPYLTGIMDPFFKGGKFTPSMQTTRGCPSSCAYCWAANKYNKCISNFSIARVKEELEYIAILAKKNKSYDIMLCDSNFGLYRRDYEIADMMYESQVKYNYPKILVAAWGKATTIDDIKRVNKLKGVTYALSMQSTDSNVLEEIHRKNLSSKKIREYVNIVHDLGKYVGTEIITGLPNETRQSHMNTIRDAMNYGFDFIDPFTFMLLDGIELDSEEAHEKFEYDIRYRLIPRNFGKINGEYSFEIEKVVVGSNSYTIEDYLYFRTFHGLLRLIKNNDIYCELVKYIEQNDINLYDWLIFVFEDLRNNKSNAAECFATFASEARTELWDSPGELIQHYSKNINYSRLLNREEGDNLMQKCSIFSSTIYFEIYVKYFTEMAEKYLKNILKTGTDSIVQEVADIREYILTKLSGVIKENIEKTKEIIVNHDILKWINDGFNKKISNYKLDVPLTVTMELSNEQLELISSIIKRYAVDENNPYGLFKTTTLVLIDTYFRKPKL